MPLGAGGADGTAEWDLRDPVQIELQKIAESEAAKDVLQDTFAVEMLLARVPREKVSKLLTQESVTEVAPVVRTAAERGQAGCEGQSSFTRI